jgi:hypothetical protein
MSKDDDDRFDRRLSDLPRVDPDPTLVRSTRNAALRVLRTSMNQDAAPRPISVRYVPALLYALSAAQLLWAATRLVAWSH